MPCMSRLLTSSIELVGLLIIFMVLVVMSIALLRRIGGAASSGRPMAPEHDVRYFLMLEVSIIEGM